MKKLGLLLSAFLTIGTNHNSILGNGTSVNLNIEHSLTQNISFLPSGSFDTNKGFRDRTGGLDISYRLNPRISVSIGAEYEKYELLAANDPTETHNIHSAVTFKLW